MTEPNLYPTFKARDLSRNLGFPGVTFEIERYSFSVAGGPKSCTIKATGSKYALQGLFNAIRGECAILDGGADKVWWGCVWSVIITRGRRVYGRTLDGFGNKIEIIYLQQTVNQIYKGTGAQATTGFTSDAASVAEYGTWEKRLRGGNGDALAAVARQTREIEARKVPQKIESISGGNRNAITATITCKGWMETLKARYYTNSTGNAAGFEQNTVVTSETTQKMGTRAAPISTDYTFTATATIEKGYANMLTGIGSYIFFTGTTSNNNIAWRCTNSTAGGGNMIVTPASVASEAAGASASLWDMGQKIYQTFTVTTEFYAAAIDIRGAKINGPTDNIVVKLYTDSGSVTPSALQATATIANADVTTSLGWLTGTLDSQIQLAVGTTYGIEISRSGTTTGLDGFVIGLDTAVSYANGSLKVYGNATIGWKTRPTNADLIFKVTGVVETTLQITNILTSVGEFVATTRVDNTAGLRVIPYQDGKTTAHQVILNLLDYGTSTGKRLLCRVTPERALNIFIEPTLGTTADLVLDDDDILRSSDTTPYPLHRCPYGVWVKDSSFEFNAETEKYKFIDEAEYVVATGEWNPRLKDRAGDLELTRLQQ